MSAAIAFASDECLLTNCHRTALSDSEYCWQHSRPQVRFEGGRVEVWHVDRHDPTQWVLVLDLTPQVALEMANDISDWVTLAIRKADYLRAVKP